MSRNVPEFLKAYNQSDFQRIAKAIGKPYRLVDAHANAFEAAAMWYRLDTRGSELHPPLSEEPNPNTPSKLKQRLSRISGSAKRLLKNLGIDNVDEAADGPGDPSIFDVLASVDGMSPDNVAAASDRVGRMAAILDGISAARELDRTAQEASKNVQKIGDLTVAKGNPGDLAINAWLAGMMSVYRKLTGSLPRASVISPGRENEGDASGPLIRFLEAAGEPLGIRYSPKAWRSRIRRILEKSD